MKKNNFVHINGSKKLAVLFFLIKSASYIAAVF